MEEEKKFVFNGDGIIFAAMLCGLVCVFGNKMSFSYNLMRWGAYSFAFLLIIVACVSLVNVTGETRKKTRAKSCLYAVLCVAACVGLCLVWAE